MNRGERPLALVLLVSKQNWFSGIVAWCINFSAWAWLLTAWVKFSICIITFREEKTVQQLPQQKYDVQFCWLQCQQPLKDVCCAMLQLNLLVLMEQSCLSHEAILARDPLSVIEMQGTPSQAAPKRAENFALNLPLEFIGTQALSHASCLKCSL